MKNRGITKKDTEIHKNRNQGRSLPVILTYSGLPPQHSGVLHIRRAMLILSTENIMDACEQGSPQRKEPNAKSTEFYYNWNRNNRLTALV